jgi:hypothetical protein
MSLIRRFMAGVAQFVGLLLILVFSAYSGFYAWGWAKAIRFISDQLLVAAAELKRSGQASQLITPDNLNIIVRVSNMSDPTIWFAIGALLGFLISTTLVAIIFMLAEIAYNTRRTVAFFERVSTRANGNDQR